MQRIIQEDEEEVKHHDGTKQGAETELCSMVSKSEQNENSYSFSETGFVPCQREGLQCVIQEDEEEVNHQGCTKHGAEQNDNSIKSD